MKKLKYSFWIIIYTAGIGFFIYKVAKSAVTDHVLESNAQQIKAVIINEKNFEPNQPVSNVFTYSYEFIINNKRYVGNSHDKSLKVGDTIVVEYSKDYPSLNKLLHPKYKR